MIWAKKLISYQIRTEYRYIFDTPVVYKKVFWPSIETFLAFSWFQYKNFLKTFLAKIFELWYIAQVR